MRFGMFSICGTNMLKHKCMIFKSFILIFLIFFTNVLCRAQAKEISEDFILQGASDINKMTNDFAETILIRKKSEYEANNICLRGEQMKLAKKEAAILIISYCEFFLEYYAELTMRGIDKYDTILFDSMAANRHITRIPLVDVYMKDRMVELKKIFKNEN